MLFSLQSPKRIATKCILKNKVETGAIKIPLMKKGVHSNKHSS